MFAGHPGRNGPPALLPKMLVSRCVKSGLPTITATRQLPLQFQKGSLKAVAN